MRRCWCSKQKLVLFLAVTTVTWLLVLLTNYNWVHSQVKEVQRVFQSSIQVNTWKKKPYTACRGQFVGYGNQFAVLRDVLLKPDDYNFYLPCNRSEVPNYWFDFGKEGTHLNTWMKQTKFQEAASNVQISDQFTIAVLRYEYANLYHTMTDWYNVFLVTKLLNVSSDNVRVIMYDHHASGHMDEAWKMLFTNVVFNYSITEPIRVKNLAWNILGYESPMNYHSLIELPYADMFHKFIIQRHGIVDAKKLDCKQLSIFFLWRRDYVAHPNNPTGLVKRKIENEDELISYFQKRFPSAKVHGDQLDMLPFKKQIELIASTDILISMHGAGLSHVMALPSHAGVVELFTTSWNKYFGLNHFQSMAGWRHLKYTAWQNLNPGNEHTNHYSYIPPISLDKHISSISHQICPYSQKLNP